jgi:hypothetical protein
MKGNRLMADHHDPQTGPDADSFDQMLRAAAPPAPLLRDPVLMRERIVAVSARPSERRDRAGAVSVPGSWFAFRPIAAAAAAVAVVALSVFAVGPGPWDRSGRSEQTADESSTASELNIAVSEDRSSAGSAGEMYDGPFGADAAQPSAAPSAAEGPFTDRSAPPADSVPVDQAAEVFDPGDLADMSLADAVVLAAAAGFDVVESGVQVEANLSRPVIVVDVVDGHVATIRAVVDPALASP